tara:strand:- start:9 stop:566 length:558 start_codon:yes stop_codon:yes gene_type:complete
LSDKDNFSVSSNNSYSQALYELAVESDVLNQVESQVLAVIKLISESQDFNNLIKDPTNKKEDQLNIINLISDKFDFNELFKRFLNFLILKRRLFFVEKILNDFLIICTSKRGEVLAKLTVAKELNESEIEKIKKDLTENFGYNVKLKYKYDPNLIGGLIIQIGSVMIDTSIKNKLQQIENKMIEA